MKNQCSGCGNEFEYRMEWDENVRAMKFTKECKPCDWSLVVWPEKLFDEHMTLRNTIKYGIQNLREKFPMQFE